MKSVLMLILSLLFSFSVHAKTLVIADIDDTLRVTNRVYASYTEQLKNILNLEQPFSGTKALMDVFDAQGATIVYLTAAIEPITEISEAFLVYNGYPQNHRFIHKEMWQSTEEFKVSEIVRLIKEEKPTTVVLIGDNGEKDPAAFARVQEIYPSTQVYVHYLYKYGTSVPVLPEGQVGYITTAEVSAHLEHQGVLSAQESSYVMSVVWNDLNASLYEQHLVLPVWSDVNEDDVAAFFGYPFVISETSGQYMIKIMNDLFARSQKEK